MLKVLLPTNFERTIPKPTDSGYWAEIQQNTKQGEKSTGIGKDERNVMNNYPLKSNLNQYSNKYKRQVAKKNGHWLFR